MVSEIYTLTNPVFRAFLCHGAIVLIKTCFMSPMTGFWRLQNKAYANEEDTKISFAKAKSLTSNPQVERIRRAHLNDLENVIPFVLLGLLYVATGPSIMAATCHFRFFTMARIAHTLVYITQTRQPFRALSFSVGFMANLSMGFQVLLHTIGSL